MKIKFEDNSYIECKKSEQGDKIIVIISAKDQNNALKKITNACELTLEEFNQLVSDVDKK